MAREIVLDTETTGFDPKTGDRLIEVGCIEIEDLLPTGRTFHRYVNPERLIPPGAIAVHGITDDKVKDAPKFHEIVPDLMEFIGDAPLIAHNAAFDRNFVDFELDRCGHPITGEARWIDTLKLAQTRFPGMANSLDALCKRFKVSLVERTLHGALIDARLLAEVYLELKGGKERVLDLSGGQAAQAAATAAAAGGPTIAIGATGVGTMRTSSSRAAPAPAAVWPQGASTGTPSRTRMAVWSGISSARRSNSPRNRSPSLVEACSFSAAAWISATIGISWPITACCVAGSSCGRGTAWPLPGAYQSMLPFSGSGFGSANSAA